MEVVVQNTKPECKCDSFLILQPLRTHYIGRETGSAVLLHGNGHGAEEHEPKTKCGEWHLISVHEWDSGGYLKCVGNRGN